MTTLRVILLIVYRVRSMTDTTLQSPPSIHLRYPHRTTPRRIRNPGTLITTRSRRHLLKTSTAFAQRTRVISRASRPTTISTMAPSLMPTEQQQAPHLPLPEVGLVAPHVHLALKAVHQAFPAASRASQQHQEQPASPVYPRPTASLMA